MNVFRASRVVVPLAAAVSLVAGTALAAPGDLDPSFGVAGVVREYRPSCEVETVVDVVADPGGGATTLLRTSCGTRPAAEVTRYLADGSRDASFGSAGRFRDADLWYADAAELVGLADGSLVVVSEGYGTVVLTKLTPAGAPDPAYGVGGRVSEWVGDGPATAVEAAELPSGEIAVVLSTVNDQTTRLVRFTPGGALAGADVLATGEAARPDDAVFGDGTLVTARGAGSTVTVSRYDLSGAPDTGFGRDGAALLRAAGAVASPVRIGSGPDGSVYAGFTVANPGTGALRPALKRLRPDGSADAGFAAGFGAGDRADEVLTALLVDTAGRVVLTTGLVNAYDGTRVARLAGGRLDPSFGTGGRAAVPVGDYAYAPETVELAGGGLLVAAETCCVNSYVDVALAKLLAS